MTTALVPAKKGELIPAKRRGRKGAQAPDFELEPPPVKGEIPERIVNELCACRRTAKDYAQAYSDACKTQAEKHGIPPAALKRYIAALVDDKLEDARVEIDALEKLLG